MSIQFFESEIQMPLMSLPLRSTLVRHQEKAILISPILFSPEQIQEIKKQGEITDIVAPTLIHHLYVPQAHDNFPKAKLWAVDGFHKKRPDIPWNQTLNRENWPHRDFLEVLELKGIPKLNEAVFFHKESKTLIVADLCFNLQYPKGFFSWMMLSLLGTYKKLNVSRLISLSVKDTAAFKKSIEQMLNWDFEKIAMSHGELVTSHGRAQLQEIFKNRKLI